MKKYEVLLTFPHGTRRMTGRQAGKKYPSFKRERGALAQPGWEMKAFLSKFSFSLGSGDTDMEEPAEDNN